MRRFLVALSFIGVLSAQAAASSLPGPLVDTAWLEAHRQRVKIIDVRGDMQSYATGHLPNAVFIPFGKVRANAAEDGVVLQDMHLSQEQFEELMRNAGISTTDAVVITHPGNGPSDLAVATYLYWQLKYYGHEEIALLDGGTAKWADEKREMRAGADTATNRGNFSVQKVQKHILATTAETKRAFESKSADLLDARPVSQFIGIDKRDYVAEFGHIPGAKLLPFDVFSPMAMGKGATFPMRSAINRGIAALALTPERPVITYCNTGHMASVDWFVLHELVGFKNVALFDGSMHAWAKHGLPVTTRID